MEMYKNKSAAGKRTGCGKKVTKMNETHTAIEVDVLSEEQLYRRLSESFDQIAIPVSLKTDR